MKRFHITDLSEDESFDSSRTMKPKKIIQSEDMDLQASIEDTREIEGFHGIEQMTSTIHNDRRNDNALGISLENEGTD